MTKVPRGEGESAKVPRRGWEGEGRDCSGKERALYLSMLSSFPGLIWPSGVCTGYGFLGLESLTGYTMSLFSSRPWTGCLFGPVTLKRV